MFRQCTDATEAFRDRINEDLEASGGLLKCVIIQGRWTGPLSDRFRLAAKDMGGFMTTSNKRNHQWLAVGASAEIAAVDTVDALERWFDSATLVDPTFFQFDKEVDETWSLEPCLRVKTFEMKPVATLGQLKNGATVQPATGYDSVSLGGSG